MFRDIIEKTFKSPSGRWSSKLIHDQSNECLVSSIQRAYPARDITESIWCAYNLSEPHKCACGTSAIFYGLAKGYSQFCSLSCSGKYTAQAALATKNLNGTNKNFGSMAFEATMVSKYGVRHNSALAQTRQKTRQSLQVKYGVSSSLDLVKDRSSSQQSESAVAKRRNTNMKTFGSISPLGSAEVQDKVRHTNIIRYGVPCVFSCAPIRARSQEQKRQHWIRHRVSVLSSTVRLLSPETDALNKNTDLIWECVACRAKFTSNLDDGKTPKCSVCTPPLKIGSKLSAALVQMFDWRLGPCKVNDRTEIAPLEIDFWFNDKKIGVEVHGLYWHSDAVLGEKKDFKKANVAKERNVRVLQFYEDEVREKTNIVLSIVNAAADIHNRVLYARKCSVRKIEHSSYFSFCDENHLQGGCSASIRYGLFLDDELIAVIGLSKARFKFGDYEIVRFCQKLNTKIHGAFSKLLKHSTAGLHGTLVTYADRRIFTGASYPASGFVFKHETQPGFWFTDFSRRFNRMRFQKHRLAEADRIAIEAGRISKIYDCGQLVFFKVL